MQLVYLAPVSWASFAQRPHKFVAWFHERTGGKVLWVEPYPTRLPRLSDWSRLRAAGDDTARWPTCPPWLKVVRSSALPIEPLPGSRILNRPRWGEVLSAVRQFGDRDRTLVGIGKPSELALSVLDVMHGCPSVYDAMDDFPAFYSGISRLSIKERERRVVERVSHMLVSSTALRERWIGARGDVRLVRNALDRSALPIGGCSSGNGDRIVFGYVGTIASWFDWAWLIALAESRPSDVVRLIGPVFTGRPLSLPKNVEILPPCDHHSALIAMRRFHVGLIPFKRTKLTESVDPIKYYEYRALDLPVMSTLFGEMRYRKDEPGVFLVDGTGDLPQVAELAVGFQGVSDEAQDFIEANTWGARFDSANILGKGF